MEIFFVSEKGILGHKVATVVTNWEVNWDGESNKREEEKSLFSSVLFIVSMYIFLKLFLGNLFLFFFLVYSLQDIKGWTSKLPRGTVIHSFKECCPKPKFIARWDGHQRKQLSGGCDEVSLVFALRTFDFCVEASWKSKVSSPGALCMIQSISGTGTWQAGQDQQALLIKWSKHWWCISSWMVSAGVEGSYQCFPFTRYTTILLNLLISFQACQLVLLVFLGKLYALQRAYAKSISFYFPFQIFIPFFL